MQNWLFFLAAFVSVQVFAQAVSPKDACLDLSGRYSFTGEWKERELIQADSEANSPYKSPNRKPRFDYDALGIGVHQIIEPAVVVIKHNLVNDVITVVVEGTGIDSRSEGFSTKLPAEIALQCAEGRWKIERNAKGGGENVPSVTKTILFLTKDRLANVVVKGQKDIETGWIFKKQISSSWTAHFNRLGE